MSDYITCYGCEVIVSETCVTVLNSWKLTTTDDIIVFTRNLFKECPTLKNSRKFSSVVNEIKVHNWLFRKRIQVERTRHTDLELKQSPLVAFMYTLASKFIK